MSGLFKLSIYIMKVFRMVMILSSLLILPGSHGSKPHFLADTQTLPACDPSLASHQQMLLYEFSGLPLI